MGLNRAKGRMFKSVGWTWSPIGGCSHNCKYCWAKSLMKRWGKTFEPQLRKHFFKDKMPNDGTWIFVGSMGDTFCKGVPREWIVKLFDFIQNDKSNNIYLLQTKNPDRFHEFIGQLVKIKDKIVLGTTIETNRETPWSEAPPTRHRAINLSIFSDFHFTVFLSLEPLSDFDLDEMEFYVGMINPIPPGAIEIGLENYTHFTVHPPDEKIIALVNWMRSEGYTVILKENLDYLNDSLEEEKKHNEV